MKKFLHLYAVLFAAMLATSVASCNTETPTADTPLITVSFNTGSLYKDLGILESMTEVVAPAGKFAIIDSVLVYDQKGALVTKAGVESRSLENKDLVLEEIPEGSYTLVLWQSVYRTADGVRAWKVAEEEALSTVKVASDGGSFNYYWVLGIASATVTLGDQSATVEMTPKPVGCILDISIDNIPEDMGYTRVALVGGHHSSGVYLDPSRQENPWIESQYLGVIFRLYPDANGKGRCFSLQHGEDLTLWVRGDKEDGYDDWGSIPHKTLEAGKSYSVYFDKARSAWQPAFFGSAEEFIAWKADRDAGLPVLDPTIEWGLSLSDVETYVHRKSWWNERVELVHNGKRWYKVYWVSDTMQEAYGFPTEDGQNLNFVICASYDPAASVEMAKALVLHQGFIPAGKIQFPGKEPYDLFFSVDKATEVFIRLYDDGSWRISYQPTDPEDLQYILP